MIAIAAQFPSGALAEGENSSKNYLFAFGGAGEGSDRQIFGGSFVDVGKFFRKNGWETRILFDDNSGSPVHLRQDIRVARAFGLPDERPQAFSEANLQRQLSDIDDRLARGKFKKGDQVLFWVDTHGWPRDPKYKTHRIECDGVCTIDVFESRIKALEAFGVKVALVDGSCYSGNSLHLTSENACIVTASGEETFSLSSFWNSFSSNLKHGANLEDVFLKARDTSPFNPQISSGAGTETRNLLSKYLDDVTPNVLEKQVENQCISDQPLGANIQDLKASLEKFLVGVDSKEVSNFVNAINQYRATLKIARGMKDKLDQLGTRKLKFDGKEYAWDTLLSAKKSLEITQNLITSEKCSSDSTDTLCVNLQNSLSGLKEYVNARDRIYATAEDFRSYEKLNDDYESYIREPKQGSAYRKSMLLFGRWRSADSKDQGPLFKAAIDAMQAEHSAYKKTYEQLSKELKNRVETCRDFRF